MQFRPSALVACLLLFLEFLAATAYASQTYTINVLPTTDTVNITQNANVSELTLNSIFNLPVLDSTKFSVRSEDISLTTTAGGAAWNYDPLSLGGNYGATADFKVYLNPTFSTHGGATSIGSDYTLEFGPYETIPFGVQPGSKALIVPFNQADLINGNVNGQAFVFEDTDGNDHFVSTGSTIYLVQTGFGGINTPTDASGHLAFAKIPILTITYTFDSLVPSYAASDLPSGNAADSEIITAYDPSSSGPIPDGLGLPPGVPEPSSLLLMGIAGIALAIPALRHRVNRDQPPHLPR